jgi:subtilisin family serine protease
LRFVRSGGVAPPQVTYVALELAGTVDIVEHDNASGTACGHSNSEPGRVGRRRLVVPHGALRQLRLVARAGHTRPVPPITGLGGGNRTFFFADSSFDDDDDGDGRNSPTTTVITPLLDNPADDKPNFLGISASAPHLAGLAALMRQKNAGPTPQAICTTSPRQRRT